MSAGPVPLRRRLLALTAGAVTGAGVGAAVSALFGTSRLVLALLAVFCFAGGLLLGGRT